MYKKSALDLNVKGANLCRFLIDEKNESLVSNKLFDAICELCQCAMNMENPLLAKSDVAIYKKAGSVAYSNIQLYLESLYMSGYISSAQKESMSNTLDSLKKEMNI